MTPVPTTGDTNGVPPFLSCKAHDANSFLFEKHLPGKASEPSDSWRKNNKMSMLASLYLEGFLWQPCVRSARKGNNTFLEPLLRPTQPAESAAVSNMSRHWEAAATGPHSREAKREASVPSQTPHPVTSTLLLRRSKDTAEVQSTSRGLVLMFYLLECGLGQWV